ncbi:hypothetical protein NQ315_001709 [Exocentrus adspersus]|uniref:Uncharacterized protein n=1 Tax=Exocentrus adspersus TaxID=1586481 RepID=A0AAV8W943_9CUCU|nr:hypothetical protein NQ315_001709 [Exocentrus adspersus]
MDKKDKEAGILQSPRFFRRKFASPAQSESTTTPQGKVVLGEVEERLKNMRQKRLDRLSTFVAEQSKLSEERGNKEQEIENAIISMKQSSEDKKTSFKVIAEEEVVVNEVKTPKLTRKGSNESKTSSTKKFINKFNCTAGQSVSSSTEDLRSDDEYEKSSTMSEKLDKVSDGNYNPLLVPIGKQRTGVYMYDADCKFLENEKAVSTSPIKNQHNIKHVGVKEKSFASEESKPAQVNPKIQDIVLRKVPTSEVSGKSFANQSPIKLLPDVKTRHSYENVLTKSNKEDKPGVLMKTFKRNSLGDILDGINDTVTEDVNKDQKFSPKQMFYENLETRKKVTVTNLNNITERVSNTSLIPPKSPMPLPRKANEDKILKKFQRNWDSLKEIVDNDSDVDADELEDLKKTFEEANTLLMEYDARLKILEKRSRNKNSSRQNLEVIVEQLKDIEEAVAHFKGLRRDRSYLDLKKTLVNFLLETSSVKSRNDEELKQKNSLRKEMEGYLKTLEDKVTRNESFLVEVLEAQVTISAMGCTFCKANKSGTGDVVLVFGGANGIVIKDFRRKGKTVKQIVFVLPEIVVTNENNEETIVYKPELNLIEPKVEYTKVAL